MLLPAHGAVLGVPTLAAARGEICGSRRSQDELILRDGPCAGLRQLPAGAYA